MSEDNYRKELLNILGFDPSKHDESDFIKQIFDPFYMHQEMQYTYDFLYLLFRTGTITSDLANRVFDTKYEKERPMGLPKIGDHERMLRNIMGEIERIKKDDRRS